MKFIIELHLRKVFTVFAKSQNSCKILLKRAETSDVAIVFNGGLFHVHALLLAIPIVRSI
jgi:hypothetical protein